MIRAVLDTNVIVSGIISEYGPPRQIILSWHQNHFVLITSEAIIAEIIRVLHYPRIQQRYQLTENDIRTVIDSLTRDAVVTEDLYRVRRSRDPSDDILLACTLESQADYLVTGDPHLAEIKYYHGVQIVGPRRFLELVAISQDKDEKQGRLPRV